MHRTYLALLTCTTILLATPAWSDLLRSNHGNTHYPIWSELSYFERSTLGDLPLARANHPDTLLALFLLASGTRELGTYESANRRIKAFVEIVQEREFDADDAVVLGEVVNRLMHDHFFLKRSESKAPSGYAEDQSRLLGIFETGEYNCISSALLYAVIMREFGVPTQGVLLPSHAFIEIKTQRGKVDVETTSPEGFAQPHTPEFYDNQSRTWHSDRGLQPATYEDYLNREHVSLTKLGARNMLNQHTSPLKMLPEDANRLAEISAYINPLDSVAQIKRLAYYNQELLELSQNNQWGALLRMYQATYTQVLYDASQLEKPHQFSRLLHYYQLGALLTYAHQGDADAVVDWLQTHLPYTPETQSILGKDKIKDSENHIAHSLQVLSEKLTEQDHFEDALLIIPIAQVLLPEHPGWPKITRFIYWQWANKHWQQSQWQAVVQIASDWLAHPDQNPRDKQAETLASKAFENIVVAAVNNADLNYANETLDRCQTEFNPQVCTRGQHAKERFLKLNPTFQQE